MSNIFNSNGPTSFTASSAYNKRNQYGAFNEDTQKRLNDNQEFVKL